MATQVASLFGVLSLDDKDFKRGVKDADKDMTGIGDQLKKVGGHLTSLGTDLTVMGAPFLAFAGLAVKSAADAEAGTAQLEAVLKSTGGAAGVTKDSALALASKLESLTTFSDDAVLSAENMLLTFTNIGKDVFPSVTMTALNMSQALGQDLKSSSMQLGKALNDPVAGITALTRVGVTFTEQQKAQIEAMVKAGDVAGAQTIILNELGREFGGSATAAAKTFSGRLAQLTNKFDNLMETIGAKLMPIAEQFLDWISQAIDWFSGLDPTIQNVVYGVIAFMGALAVIGPIIAAVGAALGAIGGVIAFLVSPIGLVVAAVVGLVAAFQTNFMGIRDIVQPIFDTIKNGLASIVGGLQYFANDIEKFGIIDAILGAFGLGKSGAAVGGGSWVEGVLFQFGMARDAAHNAITVIGNVLQGLISFISGTVIPGLQQLYNWFVTEALPAVVSFVQDTVKPALEAVFTWLAGVWENTIKPGLNALYEWFTQTALPAVKDFVVNVVQPAIQGFIDILAGIMVVVGPILNDLKDWFVTTGLPEIQKFIKNTMDNFITPLITLLKGLWDAARPGVEGIFNWFRDTFSRIGDFIKPVIDFIQSIVDRAKEAIELLRQLGGGSSQTSAQIIQGGLPANMQIPGRAGGGSVMGGRPYLVGEQGPELFTPSSSGNISTAGETAGMMGGWTINGGIHIHANSEAEGQAGMRGALAAARARGY